MFFVFPSSALQPRHPDEMYLDQVNALSGTGFKTAVVSLDDISAGKGKFRPVLDQNTTVVYRGWMLGERDYQNLVQAINAAGAAPLTSTEQYLLTHHLPRWYSLLSDLTPETVVLSTNADMAFELRNLGWERFFLKDYVKSLKTSVGSVVDDPSKADIVILEMKKYRDTIEGGICVRKFEDFVAGSEIRYFVINGAPYSPNPGTKPPDIAFEVARRIQSRFFSLDIAMRSDGTLRVVEIGDGQVSDVVGWTVDRFAAMWTEAS